MTLSARRNLAIVIMLIAAVAAIWLIDRRVQRSVELHQGPETPAQQVAPDAVE